MISTVTIVGCEFSENVLNLHEELTVKKLQTTTMSPRNEFGAVYKIDNDNKSPKRFDIIEFQFDDEYFDKNDFYSSN